MDDSHRVFGATQLFFPPHGGGGAGFASPHVDRDKVTDEAIIRELLQNALDAATGNSSVRVIFRHERIPTADLPCKNDYEQAFDNALTYRRVQRSVDSPVERQAIDRISSCLKAPELSVLVCTDCGEGIGEKGLRPLYNTGDTTKRSGRGSVGLGHLTAFAASDLRYVLYAGRQQSGHVTFGGHAVLATSRGESGAGPQQDAHGYVRGAEEMVDTPASEASGASIAPDLVRGWLPGSGSGSAVAILGYASDETGDLGDNILLAAAKNFVVAIHRDALTVTVRTEQGRELVLGSDNLGSVLAGKREQQRLRRSLGVRGREAWSAYETLTLGTPLEVDGLPGVSVWLRELPPGDRTLVCFFREGMWITSQAKHLQRTDFEDRAPFAAVVNVDEPGGEDTESVCSLVREAEGETHSQIRPTEITDQGMKRRLDVALKRIRRLLRDHAPEMLVENIEPEQLRFFHGKTLTVVPRPPRRDTTSKETEEDVLEVVSDGRDGGGRGGGGSGGGGGDRDGSRRAPRKVSARGNPSGIRTTSRHLGGRRWAVAWKTNVFHSGAAGVRVVVPSGADETTDRYLSDEHLPIAALRMNGQTVTPHDTDRVEVLLAEPSPSGEAEIELAEDPHELDMAVLRVQMIHRGKSASGARA